MENNCSASFYCIHLRGCRAFWNVGGGEGWVRKVWYDKIPFLPWAISPAAVSFLVAKQVCTAPEIQFCWVYLDPTRCQNIVAMERFDLVGMALAGISGWFVVFSRHPKWKQGEKERARLLCTVSILAKSSQYLLAFFWYFTVITYLRNILTITTTIARKRTKKTK